MVVHADSDRLMATDLFPRRAILVAPALDRTTGRRARKLSWIGAGLFVAALAVLIPIFNQQPAPHPLPDARANAFFEDPASGPKMGEWTPLASRHTPRLIRLIDATSGGLLSYGPDTTDRRPHPQGREAH
jgi:hypothetical protein